jgi:hypothetical protein
MGDTVTHYRFSGIEFDGGDDGDLFFITISASGRPLFTRLAIPSDWEEQEDAGTPYFLGIISGYPAWRTLATEAVGEGFGNNWGNNWGNGA